MVSKSNKIHAGKASHINIAQHFYPQLWLLVMSVIVFGIYVAFDLGFFHQVYAIDRSYLSLVIIGMFVIASAHALWHIVSFSARITVANGLVSGETSVSEFAENVAAKTHHEPGLMILSPEFWVNGFINDLRQSEQASRQSSQPEADTQSVVEIYADKLRSPVELGWYIVDIAIRLGLIGTIIGFILIFSTLSANTVPGTDELQAMLISMSSGMGTALYTTLCGLVGATFLGLQYFILGREVEHLIALLMRLRNQELISVFPSDHSRMEPDHDRRTPETATHTGQVLPAVGRPY